MTEFIAMELSVPIDGNSRTTVFRYEEDPDGHWMIGFDLRDPVVDVWADFLARLDMIRDFEQRVRKGSNVKDCAVPEATHIMTRSKTQIQFKVGDGQDRLVSKVRYLPDAGGDPAKDQIKVFPRFGFRISWAAWLQNNRCLDRWVKMIDLGRKK